MLKSESDLHKFKSLHEFYYTTIEHEYYSYIDDCKEFFFQGFEWADKIVCKKVNALAELTYRKNEIDLKPIKKTDSSLIIKCFFNFIEETFNS